MGDKKIRVLLTKSGLDGHDRGVRYLSQLLKDNGAEVIFTRYHVIDDAVKQAMEEDVDILGVSFFCGGLMYDSERLLKIKKKYEIEDRPVMVGGSITEEEETELLAMGIDKVYRPNKGTMQDIVDFVMSGDRK